MNNKSSITYDGAVPISTEISEVYRENFYDHSLGQNRHYCFDTSFKTGLKAFTDRNKNNHGYKISSVLLSSDKPRGDFFEQIVTDLTYNDFRTDDTLKEFCKNICGESSNPRRYEDLQIRDFFDHLNELDQILIVLPNFSEYHHLMTDNEAKILLNIIRNNTKIKWWLCANCGWNKNRKEIISDLYSMFSSVQHSHYEAYMNGQDFASVYISYNWKDLSDSIADQIERQFLLNDIDYRRDKKDCGYRANITQFMDTIRTGQTVVVIFSDVYLHSINCLYELTGIISAPGFPENLFPIVYDDSIREDSYFVNLSTFWKEKLSKYEEYIKEIKLVGDDYAFVLEKKEDIINKIKIILPKIKEYLDPTNALSISILEQDNYNELITKIKDRLKKLAQ